jgi:hypothetical protein
LVNKPKARFDFAQNKYKYEKSALAVDKLRCLFFSFTCVYGGFISKSTTTTSTCGYDTIVSE